MAASASSKSEKIVLVGDFGVGKSTIFTRFKTGAAKDVTLNTRKECECTRDLLVDGTKTSITLYDTAGMERFEGTIPPTYFRQARGVIFVYAIDNSESINNINGWGDSITPERLEYAGVQGDIIRILCGNKLDLEKKREVTEDRAYIVADNCHFEENHVFEISALNGDGFEKMFSEVVRTIRALNKDETTESTTVDLGSSKKQKKKNDGSGCCN